MIASTSLQAYAKVKQICKIWAGAVNRMTEPQLVALFNSIEHYRLWRVRVAGFKFNPVQWRRIFFDVERLSHGPCRAPSDPAGCGQFALTLQTPAWTLVVGATQPDVATRKPEYVHLLQGKEGFPMPFDDGLPQEEGAEEQVQLRVFVTPLSAVNQQGGTTVKIYDGILQLTEEEGLSEEALSWGARSAHLPYAYGEQNGVLRPVIRPALFSDWLQREPFGAKAALKMGFMAEQRLENPQRKFKTAIPMSQPRLLAYLGGQPIPRAISPEPERDSDGEDW